MSIIVVMRIDNIWQNRWGKMIRTWSMDGVIYSSRFHAHMHIGRKTKKLWINMKEWRIFWRLILKIRYYHPAFHYLCSLNFTTKYEWKILCSNFFLIDPPENRLDVKNPPLLRRQAIRMYNIKIIRNYVASKIFRYPINDWRHEKERWCFSLCVDCWVIIFIHYVCWCVVTTEKTQKQSRT